MWGVWSSYAMALGHIACNFFIALGLIFVLRRFSAIRLSCKFQNIATLVGTIALLTAGLGKLGWEIQSYSGTNPPEILNDKLFLFLSHFGRFLIFVEWCWSIWAVDRGIRNGVNR